jgi:hypothetical protein
MDRSHRHPRFGEMPRSCPPRGEPPGGMWHTTITSMRLARSIIPLLAAVLGVLLAQGGWTLEAVVCQPNTASMAAWGSSCDSEPADSDDVTDDAVGCGCDPTGRTCCCVASPARPAPQRVPSPPLPTGGERVDPTFFAFPPVSGLLPEPPTILTTVPAARLLPVGTGESTRLEVLCRRQT